MSSRAVAEFHPIAKGFRDTALCEAYNAILKLPDTASRLQCLEAVLTLLKQEPTK